MEETNTNTQDDRQPLWKQVLGAIVGGSLALGLYYTYDFAKPKVTAYLTLPPAERVYDLGSSHIADKTTDEGNRKRLLSRNVRVAQQMKESAIYQDSEALNTVDDHSMDIAWPGHDPSDPKYTEVTGLEPPKPEAESADDMQAPMEPQVLEEQMTSEEMQADNWEALWGEINAREQTANVEHINADDLSDTGFGLGFVLAGAVGGAVGAMKKKRNAEMQK